MDVRGRAAARRYEGLHHKVGAAGLLACDEERVVIAGPPVRRAGGGGAVKETAGRKFRA
jgi:hypothetical protein